MVAAAATLFALNQPLSRVLVDGPLPPRYLAASRLLTLAVVFSLWTLLRYRDRLPRGRELTVTVVYGVIGIAVLQWTLTEAISRLDSGLVLVFAYTASIPTALWCRFVRHERLGAVAWGAMVVALGGLALALGVGGATFDSLDGVGLLFSGATSLLFAYYAIHGGALIAHRPAPVVLAVGSVAAAVAWTLTFAPIWRFPTAILTERLSLGGNLADVRVAGVLALAWTVMMGTAVPYALYLIGIGRIGPTLGILTGSIEPVITVVAAWLWLDQALTPWQVCGCAVVLAAVSVGQIARRPAIDPVTQSNR
jgi:drug/metabolite transporter (DMT)-like permease